MKALLQYVTNLYYTDEDGNPIEGAVSELSGNCSGLNAGGEP